MPDGGSAAHHIQHGVDPPVWEVRNIWDLKSGELRRTLRRDRPYERLDISGVKGLTEAQRASLRALGAVEERAGPLTAEQAIAASPTQDRTSNPPRPAQGGTIRCPRCDNVLMRIVHARGRYWLDMQGVRILQIRENLLVLYRQSATGCLARDP